MNPVKLITPSTLEVVTLTEAKAHLKVTGTDEDTLIETYLKAAVQRVENYRQSPIMSSEWELYSSSFAYNVNLQKHPVSAINSVQYWNDDDTPALTTVDPSNYRLQDYRVPCRLEFDSDYDFQETDEREYPVVINFQAGFTYAASAHYQNIKHVVLATLGTYNELRQMEMTGIGLAGIKLSQVSMDILDNECMWL